MSMHLSLVRTKCATYIYFICCAQLNRRDAILKRKGLMFILLMELSSCIVIQLALEY